MNQSELQFLVSLLLEHKLPKATQTAVKERMKVVEEAIRTPVQTVPVNFLGYNTPLVHTSERPAQQQISQQSPSTLRILQRNPDLIQPGIETSAVSAINTANVAPPLVSAAPIIVNSPIVANAMAERQARINEAIAGPKKGSLSAPKTHGPT